MVSIMFLIYTLVIFAYICLMIVVSFIRIKDIKKITSVNKGLRLFLNKLRRI